MTVSYPKVPLYKKLTVLFRLEPGCLGPDGKDHIEGFCQFAKKKLGDETTYFVRWVLTPRYDKTLPEMEFSVNNQSLTEAQVQSYLDEYNQDFDDFDERIQEQLSELIDTYLGR